MRRLILIIAAIVTSGAVIPIFVGISTAASLPSGHNFTVWTDAQARSVSTLLGSVDAQTAHGAGANAVTFTNRVNGSLSQIEQQLGSNFASAAIDPVAGNILVVRVAGNASSVTSSLLTSLDGNGGQVRIVQNQPSAATFETQYAAVSKLVGTVVGTSRVLQVSRDDMAERVIVGVDSDATGAQAILQGEFSLVTTEVAAQARPTDGGHWGSNFFRALTPIAAGQSVAVGPYNTNTYNLCTSAFPVTVGGQPSLITAGHCTFGTNGAPTWLADSANINIAKIGSTEISHAFDGTGIDAAAVHNTTGSSRACTVTTNGTATEPPNSCVNLTFNPIGPVQGATVTDSGATTGDSNGVITSTSAVVGISEPGASETLTNAIETNNCILGGDSGSPLYESNGNGTVNALAIADGTTCATFGGQGTAIYTNWQIACVMLGVDATYCPQAIPVNLAAGTNLSASSRRIQVFARDPNGGVISTVQSGPNGAFSGWADLAGTNLVGTPVAGQNADGRLEVFMRNGNGGIMTKFETTPGGPFNSAWYDLGGLITSDPALGVNADGRLELFAVDSAGGVMTAWQTAPNGGWSSWLNLGGTNLVGKPVVGSNADGRIEIFVKNGNGGVGTIFQTAPNGTFSPTWTDLGGLISSNPTLAVNADGRLEIFGTTSGGSVSTAWQTAPNGAWSGWLGLGGTNLVGAPIAGSNADGRIEIFVRNGNSGVGTIYQTAPNGTFTTTWTDLGGLIAVDPVLGDNADGRIQLFGLNIGNGLTSAFQTAPNGGWTGWSYLTPPL